MKKMPSVYRIPFDNLHTHFKGMPGQHAATDCSVGMGLVRVFNVEAGLQAKVWDCTSAEALELFYEAETTTASTYFTLAFFLQMEGLQFANNRTPFQEYIIWDTLFISSASCLRMSVPPSTRIHCLTISFSKKWLNQNLLTRDSVYEQLQQKITSPDGFIMQEYMHASERQFVATLVNESLHTSVPIFYVKACVLKTLSDFFNKIKEKQILCIANDRPTARTLNALLIETENLLSTHISGKLPDLKNLACQYGLSETTLKRHFKQQHGINPSTYFVCKKMEYARKLIREYKMSLPNVAQVLGYKNLYHFMATYGKRFNPSAQSYDSPSNQADTVM
jgi:AraC-like DNA-binding protein